jgi:shikimate kinase
VFPLYIIGFMGAGKTTIGKMLSQELHLPVHDTDQLVEQEEGKKVSAIFAEKGEPYFRNRESEILYKTMDIEGIITTGGGIILREENRELIQNKGTSIFLKCDIEIVMKRIQDDTSRPLFFNKSIDEVKALYDYRLPLYENSAQFIVDTTDLTIVETVNEIITRIKSI